MARAPGKRLIARGGLRKGRGGGEGVRCVEMAMEVGKRQLGGRSGCVFLACPGAVDGETLGRGPRCLRVSAARGGRDGRVQLGLKNVDGHARRDISCRDAEQQRIGKIAGQQFPTAVARMAPAGVVATKAALSRCGKRR